MSNRCACGCIIPDGRQMCSVCEALGQAGDMRRRPADMRTSLHEMWWQCWERETAPDLAELRRLKRERGKSYSRARRVARGLL
jgi:hypothetical protein